MNLGGRLGGGRRERRERERLHNPSWNGCLTDVDVKVARRVESFHLCVEGHVAQPKSDKCDLIDIRLGMRVGVGDVGLDVRVVRARAPVCFRCCYLMMSWSGGMWLCLV